jgi:hypothetical protein
MTKHLLFVAALALASSAALADPRVDSMVGQCRCVMEGGECRVYNRPPAKGPVYTTRGVIPKDAYNAIRAEGGLMCQTGGEACLASWDGDKCRAFRLMFRADLTWTCVPKQGK